MTRSLTYRAKKNKRVAFQAYGLSPRCQAATGTRTVRTACSTKEYVRSSVRPRTLSQRRVFRACFRSARACLCARFAPCVSASDSQTRPVEPCLFTQTCRTTCDKRVPQNGKIQPAQRMNTWTGRESERWNSSDVERRAARVCLDT